MGDLSIGVIAWLAVAAATGALIQGSIGFGSSFAIVPALGLVQPEAIPVTMLVLAIPMTTWMALHERHAIDWPGYLWILIGRIPGTALGLWILVVVPLSSFEVLIGGLILAAVAMSVVGPGFVLRGRTRIVAGVAAGTFGTAVGIGGPPLALIYQERPGPELRSTLAISFITGLAVSLATLAVAGRVEGWQVVLALEMVPGLAAGLVLARLVARWLDERWLRPAVLLFAGVAGAVALTRGALG